MIRTGTDIVEISRFTQMKRLDSFKKKVFTERELEYILKAKNSFESIAGAFAAKEAFSKFLGSGVRGFNLRDIEVLHNPDGKPYLCFKGFPVDADVSISHSDYVAVAVVCGENADYLPLPKDCRQYAKLLPRRFPDMHKGDCGRVFIVAGSVGMTGAACLCSKAAMRCGSGLVTLGTPECVQPVAATSMYEVMTLPLPCKDGMLSSDSIEIITKNVQKNDVCAIGPGLGKTESILKIVSAILKESTPCVIDADALNALSGNTDILKSKNCEVVITPHPAEMARLTNLTIDEINSRREDVAKNFAKEYNCIVVLKGNKTVIASPDGDVRINNSGNSGMASGGMGDVLTGVIASFTGQGCPLFDAATLGVFIHGLAADIAATRLGEFGLIASDVIGSLPFAIMKTQHLHQS